ncbi:MAG: arylsulfatase A-like enzyme [Planctomycetota bacterium]|jgi:arylsulfatase A-like enzyme
MRAHENLQTSPAFGARVCCVLAVALAACSRSEVAPEPAGVTKLVLERSPGEPLSSSNEVVYRRHAATDDPPTWKAIAEHSSIETIEWMSGDVDLGAHVQVLRDPDRRRIELRGPFPSSAFDRVRIGLLVLGRQSVTVELQTAEGRLRSKSVDLLRKGPRISSFDFPQNRDTRGQIESVLIHFGGESKTAAVAFVELLQRPLIGEQEEGAYLPGDQHAANFIELGDDARVATVLGSEAGLRTRAVLPNGTRLAFAIGVPRIVRDASATSTLLVRALQDGVEQLLRVELPEHVDHWQSVHIPAADLRVGESEGSVIELEFDLEVVGELTSYVVLANVRVEAPRTGAPRVLLITSDTHRADYLGVVGGSQVLTPALDKLASRGVIFRDAWAPANSTQPSHAAIMTGLHPRDTAVTYNGKQMSSSLPTLAEAFRSRGWSTYAVVSAAHLRDDVSGLWRGFDRASAPPADYRDSKESLETLERWLPDAQEVPLFLWLHIFDAHGPYDPPPETYRDLIAEGHDPHATSLAPLPSEHKPEWDQSVRDVEYVRALYRGEVRYLDQRLAGVLNHPLLSGAWVAFAGDHGECLPGDPTPWFNHIGISPATLAVPLLMAGPGIESARTVMRGVTIVDVGRTLLDVAGYREADFPGQNLLEQEIERPRFALESKARSASLRAGSWFLKLDLWTDPRQLRDGQHQHVTELFDLEHDPRGVREVSGDEVARTRQMRARLVDWLLQAPDETRTGRTKFDKPGMLDQLAGLGYTADGAGATVLFDADCACVVCEQHREGN